MDQKNCGTHATDTPSLALAEQRDAAQRLGGCIVVDLPNGEWFAAPSDGQPSSPTYRDIAAACSLVLLSLDGKVPGNQLEVALAIGIIVEGSTLLGAPIDPSFLRGAPISKREAKARLETFREAASRRAGRQLERKHGPMAVENVPRDDQIEDSDYQTLASQLGEDDLEVLKYLAIAHARQPTRTIQTNLRSGTGRGAILKCLKRLSSLRLVHQPAGRNKGYGVTERGAALVQHIPNQSRSKVDPK